MKQKQKIQIVVSAKPVDNSITANKALLKLQERGFLGFDIKDGQIMARFREFKTQKNPSGKVNTYAYDSTASINDNFVFSVREIRYLNEIAANLLGVNKQ